MRIPPLKSPLFWSPFERIVAVTGAGNTNELALLLGVRRYAVEAAVKAGAVPEPWLFTLLYSYGVYPDWVLSGAGPVFAPCRAASLDAILPERAVAARLATLLTPLLPHVLSHLMADETILKSLLHRFPTRLLRRELKRRKETA